MRQLAPSCYGNVVESGARTCCFSFMIFVLFLDRFQGSNIFYDLIFHLVAEITNLMVSMLSFKFRSSSSLSWIHESYIANVQNLDYVLFAEMSVVLDFGIPGPPQSDFWANLYKHGQKCLILNRFVKCCLYLHVKCQNRHKVLISLEVSDFFLKRLVLDILFCRFVIFVQLVLGLDASDILVHGIQYPKINNNLEVTFKQLFVQYS